MTWLCQLVGLFWRKLCEKSGNTLCHIIVPSTLQSQIYLTFKNDITSLRVIAYHSRQMWSHRCHRICLRLWQVTKEYTKPRQIWLHLWRAWNLKSRLLQIRLNLSHSQRYKQIGNVFDHTFDGVKGKVKADSRFDLNFAKDQMCRKPNFPFRKKLHNGLLCLSFSCNLISYFKQASMPLCSIILHTFRIFV